jgi:hypothetical protein
VNSLEKGIIVENEKEGCIVERGEYKGKPLLVIKRDENDKYPFSFGISKAKMIVENFEEIKKFVQENSWFCKGLGEEISMNIFVGNMAFTVTEEDVLKLFEAYGTVSSAVIVMEKKGKKSRGFGFVDMPDPAQAQAAIAALNAKEWMGRPLNVSQAREKTEEERTAEALERKRLKRQKRNEERARENDSAEGAQKEAWFTAVTQKTGGYKGGRRTKSYARKVVGAQEPMAKPPWKKHAATHARAHTPPYVRQGKEYSRPAHKSVRGPKPWQKAEGPALGARPPWKRSEGAASGARPPWKRAEGAASGARPPWKRAEGAASGARPPWKRAEGGPAKPWQKRSDRPTRAPRASFRPRAAQRQ